MVQEKAVTLVYGIKNDYIVDICTKPLLEAKFVKFQVMLKLQTVAIMGGCHLDIISPPKSLDHYANVGVLQPWVMLVNHTSRPFGENQSIDQLEE